MKNKIYKIKEIKGKTFRISKKKLMEFHRDIMSPETYKAVMEKLNKRDKK